MKNPFAHASVLSLAIILAGCSKTEDKTSSVEKTGDGGKSVAMGGGNANGSNTNGGNLQNQSGQTKPNNNPPRKNSNTSASEVTWLTSFSDARAAAKKSGKPVMINFTDKAGTGRCKVLKKQVLDTAKFKQWATDNVVLLELDFPQSGTSAENRKLQGLYQVRGFPMIIFINAEGAIYGKMGRIRGGPDSWLSTAKRALANTNPTAVAGLSTGSGSNPPKNP